MFYYTYKTTNTINGKYYYGRHSAKRLRNSYLGSGVAIKTAIKKYGKACFSKEIINIFLTYDESVADEICIVTKDIVDDPMSYNLTEGGEGGGIAWTEDRKKHHSEKMKGRNTGKDYYTEDGYNDLVEKTKKRVARGEIGIKKGAKFNQETCDKMSLYWMGRPRQPHRQETKDSISKNLKGEKNPCFSKKRIQSTTGQCLFVFPNEVESYLKSGWLLYKDWKKHNGAQAPNTKIWELEYNGNIIVVLNMMNFCKDNNLSYQNFSANGKHKGYTVLRKYKPNAS